MLCTFECPLRRRPSRGGTDRSWPDSRRQVRSATRTAAGRTSMSFSPTLPSDLLRGRRRRPLFPAKVLRLLAARLELLQTLSPPLGLATPSDRLCTRDLIHRRDPLLAKNRVLPYELVATYQTRWGVYLRRVVAGRYRSILLKR